MVEIGYDRSSQRAVIRTEEKNTNALWFLQLRRTLADCSATMEEPEPGVVTLPWWSFVSVREHVGTILRDVPKTFSHEATGLLRTAALRQRAASEAARLPQPSAKDVTARLKALGFRRKLTPEQVRNVGKLSSLPAGATFSVPGAGKTTEALAYYFLNASPLDGLLVVSPLNAFGAWDEQLEICMGPSFKEFVRLRRGRDNIAEALGQSPQFKIISYQQLPKVVDMVAEFIASNPTFVFLDESHRIKSGKGRVTADAVLSLSHLPTRKLILSGTPMPQATDDLVPQVEFLYPEIRTDPTTVVRAIQSLFVRTTKDELKLPAVRRLRIDIPLRPAQQQLYDLMRSETARVAELALNLRTRQALRGLGRSVMRLLRVVSNPRLLAADIGFLHQELLSDVVAEGIGPKVKFACERARQLARGNRKTLIWSSFRQNVESIADQLTDLGAVYIHGSVDAGEEDDENSREGKIRRFHDDTSCMVLVANPAAAGEGISLHKVCRNALYVDRTFNAAHYLQSEDRIHRLGLGPRESPTIEILVSPGTIDESVALRLTAKVRRMATALNDKGLTIDPIPLDQYESDPENEDDEGSLDLDDVKSILQWLQNSR